MSKVVIIFLLFLFVYSIKSNQKSSDHVEKKKETTEFPVAERLMLAYPDFIVDKTDSSIIWNDGYEMILDDGMRNKSFDSLLNFPDIEDQFVFEYTKGEINEKPVKNFDPGRIRNQPFFKRMYGESKEAVLVNLTEISWLPNSYNKKFLVSKVNGVSEKLAAVSEELEKDSSLIKYLIDIGGTFNWRTISGTDRLSAHSFGIAIDLNVKFSNYWKWDYKDHHTIEQIEYKNQIPIKIVEIFEKHGFIWGGKWYHYDTMHFEYRPELLIEKEKNTSGFRILKFFLD